MSHPVAGPPAAPPTRGPGAAPRRWATRYRAPERATPDVAASPEAAPRARTAPTVDGVRLSIVVPFHESRSTLGPCIEAIVRAARPGDEVIVADDGSTDGGAAELAPGLRRHVKVVRHEVNRGPGPTRNLGVAAATGDVVVFVDADVTVHPDALRELAAAFDEEPARVAVIGSYDDRPSHPGLVSRYRNLLHHHVHHTRGRTATHFWTGLGAVRRDVFAELGGFDEERWGRVMEDVEFGHRLVDAGHTIEVRPDVEGTHHKRFTLRTMVETDVVKRAAPWTDLMWRDHLRTDRFVVSAPDTASALAVVAGVGAALAAVTGSGRRAPRVAALSAGAFVAVNGKLWAAMARAGGLRVAVAAVPLHAVHVASAVTGFAWGTARWAGGRLGGPPGGRRAG